MSTPSKTKYTPRGKETTAKLKKDLDKYFSLYIRQFWANNSGLASCYTCHKVLHWRELHCGHFIPRNILITRWNEDNCRPQCVGCNVFGNGKILDFEDRLVREMGQKEVDKLKASRFTIVKLDANWYREKIAHYKSLIHK